MKNLKKILTLILSLLTITSFAQTNDVVDFQRFRIQLTTANNWEKDAVIVFKDDATEAYHEMYDVLRLPGSPNAAIFTIVIPNEYTLKAFPELTSSRIVYLGVVNTFAGTSKLSMTEFLNFNTTTQVFLEDIEMGVFHNLTKNAEYTYENQPVNQDIRFRLHFQAPIIIYPYSSCIGESNGKLVIINPNSDIPVNITVNDFSNQVIANTGFFVGERVIDGLASGNYTVEFAYADSTIIDYITVNGIGFNVAPSFTASATEVSIVDAIIEFLGNAQGSNEYIWDFGDGTIITGMLNPVHTYMHPGDYTVTFRAFSGGCESTYCKIIKVNNTTSLNNLFNDNIILYPNPAKNKVNINLNSNILKISILDMSGRLLKTIPTININNDFIEIDVDILDNGIYRVVLEAKNLAKVLRLSIIK
jgi:hypothetical protein